MLAADALEQLLDDLRAGRPVTDEAFDRLYPHEVRELSDRFWTPLEVAYAAARFFAASGATRVLDVGAGVGKFCLAGALAAPSVRFVGVEQRPHLVAVAKSALYRSQVHNAVVLQGPAELVAWERFDAFYFFNPFDENRFPLGHRLDDTVELSFDRFEHDVAIAEERLRAAKPGTCVATYHGFGGTMPIEYDLVREEVLGSDALRLWVKGSGDGRRPPRLD